MSQHFHGNPHHIAVNGNGGGPGTTQFIRHQVLPSKNSDQLLEVEAFKA